MKLNGKNFDFEALDVLWCFLFILMKKIIVIIVVVALLVIALIVALNFMREDDQVVRESQRSNEVSVESHFKMNGEGVEQSVLEKLKNDSDVEIAKLVSVDGSESEGVGYRLYRDGTLFHAVEARMPDPGVGVSYEGWLVQKIPLRFFSTGVMKKNEEGVWVLEYVVDKGYPRYLEVVITKETIVDEKPEEHVIEGSF